MRRAHDNFDKKFGIAIRITRIKQKLSQAELGAALGVTFQQIQKYESGANAVASTRIPDLCRALKTCPDDLFGFRGETASTTAANGHLCGADSTAARWA